MTNEQIIEMALRRQRHPRPGQVSIIQVRHDDWCAIFKGGECNCRPEIVVPEEN